MSVTAARRYARALFELAEERKAGPEIAAELQLVAETLQEVPTLGDVLVSSSIPAEAKKNILRQVFSTQVSPVTLNFLLLTVDKGRIGEFPDIYRQYLEMLRASRGVIKGEVVSAVPLDEAELTRLQSRLQEVTGKEVELQARVDPGLIGGLVVRVDDRVIDGSIRTRLANLRQALVSRQPAT